VVLFRWRNSQGWPVEYVSPNVTGLLGYSVDELQGHETRYAGLIAAADLAQVMGEVERAEREGTPSFTHRAYRVRRKDGSERWLSGRTQALRNEAGEVTHFLGYVFDAAGQMPVPDSPAAPEQCAKAIVDNTHAVIYVKDLDGKYLQVNKRCEELCHVTWDEVVGKTDFDLFPAAEAEMLRDNDRQVVQLDHSMEFEEPLSLRDGRHTYISLKFPLHNEAGEIYGICGVSTDITERMRAEEALRVSESLLTRSQRVANFGNWDLDLVTGELAWSDEEYRVLGYEPGAVEPTVENFLQAVHPDDREAMRRTMERAMRSRGEDSCQIEHRLLRADGQIRYVDQRAYATHDDTGRPLRMFGTTHDITERKKTELSLRGAYGDLKLLLDERAHDLAELSRQVQEGIRKRVEADEARRKSEYRYRRLMEDASDAIVVIEAQSGLVLDVNREASALIRRPADEIEGMHYLQLCSRAKAEEYAAIFATLVAGGVPYRGEILVWRADAQEIPVEIRASLIELDGCRVVQVIFHDITEKKEREQALIESENRFRLLYDNAPIPFQSLDKDGCYLEVNQTWLDTFGYAREEVIGRHLSEFLSPGQSERFSKRVNDFDSFGECSDVEFEMVNRDGSVRLVSVTGKAVYEGHGQFVKSYCTLTDITQRKKMERQLEEANEEWRKTFDTVSDPIAIIDNEFRIVKANRAVAERLGLPMSEILGEACYRCMHGEDEPSEDCPHKRMMEDGQEHTAEVVAKGMGSEFLVTASPLYDSQNRLIGSVHIGHDLTELKRAEEKRLNQLQQHKNEVVREIHHRIKNHLQGLMGLLKQRRQGHPEHAGVLDEAMSQIESIAVVYGLQAQHSDTEIYFRQMLDAIVSSAAQLSHIPILLSFELDGCLFKVDRDKAVVLSLVVNELLVNAIKHYQSSGNGDAIKVHPFCEENGIAMEVRNPGRLPDGFDWERGTGLGTGLELVKVMLPERGAKVLVDEMKNEVTVKLVLRPPLLADVRQAD